MLSCVRSGSRLSGATGGSVPEAAAISSGAARPGDWAPLFPHGVDAGFIEDQVDSGAEIAVVNVTVDSPWESQVGRFAYPPIPLLLVRPGRKVTPLAESDRMVPSAGDAVIALIPSG